MKVVLLYSGGADSTLALYELRRLGWDVVALFVDYGQRNIAFEFEHARLHCAPRVMTLRGLADLSGLDPKRKGNPQAPVVPARNLLFLSLAANLASCESAGAVAIGCNLDDAREFPDCRPEFINAAQVALGVDVLAPNIGRTKLDVFYELAGHNVEPGDTWSCYSPDGGTPCGKCGACLRRSSC